MDGVMITNEIIDYWRRNKLQGVILKLDFEKAYDTINWEYVLDLMDLMGFGQKWCAWIKECISTPQVSILVNGSPTSEVPMSRGLRQGDPLSPFLFNIAVEGLNILLHRARS